MIAGGSKHIVLLLIQSAKLFVLVQELRQFLTVFRPVLLETLYGSRLALKKLSLELLKRFDSVFVFFDHIFSILILTPGISLGPGTPPEVLVIPTRQ